MKGPRPASDAMIAATLRFGLSAYPLCDFPPIPTYGGTRRYRPWLKCTARSGLSLHGGCVGVSLDEVVVHVEQDLLDFENIDTRRSPLLRISVSWMGGIAIMVLAGEVDLSTASLVQEHLEEIIPDLRSDLVVDLGLVTFLGSTGMSILVLVHRQLQAQGSRLVVFAPTPRIRSLFEICDLNSVLVIVPDNSDEN